MKEQKTERGFSLASFEDFYGNPCELQKSSIATQECIWLGLRNVKAKVMAKHAEHFGIQTEDKTGWVDYPIPDGVFIGTRMHLDREQVKKLLPYLQKFADTGEI